MRDLLFIVSSGLTFCLQNPLRKTRDELSHNVFLMLQETNKFREHQSRHNLIVLLEEELKERQKLIGKLGREMVEVDEILGKS